MNRSLNSLKTPDVMAGAAVFFEDIDLGLGVRVSGLVSSTIAELQAIALALKCIFFFCSVNLFSDSQAALDACKSELVLACPNFRNQCWVEHYYIVNVICHKNLDVNWIKVKDVEVLYHVFSCSFDAAGHAQLIKAYVFTWETCSGLFRSFSCVLQLLYICVFNVVIGTALYKDFVFKDWYREFVSIFKDPKVAAQNIVSFVCKFCLAFEDNIWLVHIKHWAIMEKGGLISQNGSASVPVSGLPVVLLAGMIRLLDIADVFGISFEFCKFC
ncbi:hypothetical protein G9A89_013660 [Geosiphon pyriformis]|nr:hypothetical protein G9A89_013660 [Geosiphon pyriformis]